MGTQVCPAHPAAAPSLAQACGEHPPCPRATRGHAGREAGFCAVHRGGFLFKQRRTELGHRRQSALLSHDTCRVCVSWPRTCLGCLVQVCEAHTEGLSPQCAPPNPGGPANGAGTMTPGSPRTEASHADGVSARRESDSTARHGTTGAVRARSV